MSIPESIALIKEWHQHNEFQMETDDSGNLSVTATFDAILSKKREKVNKIVLFGGSNAGKSIILKSTFEVFSDVNYMYQGVANNFMFEGMEDAEVCIWEEALFSVEQQETIKLIMEGAETAAAAKYRKNVQIDRVPLGITCNVLPWVMIPGAAHKKAFENKSIIFKCREMPQLIDYPGKGRINPHTWLRIDTVYWHRQEGKLG